MNITFFKALPIRITTFCYYNLQQQNLLINNRLLAVLRLQFYCNVYISKIHYTTTLFQIFTGFSMHPLYTRLCTGKGPKQAVMHSL